MATTLEEIEAAAMSLSDEQRDYLAETLWRSVHGEPQFDAEQIAEWDRRWDELRSGRVAHLTHEQFFANDESR